jgi:hypothetical protein
MKERDPLLKKTSKEESDRRMTMITYKVKTYDEACDVIKEIGILPLAPLWPDYPALNTITSDDSWHTGTEFDPWGWRTKFPAEGVAAYGKFIKKKNILISKELLPYFLVVLGNNNTVEDRYKSGNVSRDAFELYKLIHTQEGIDTRELRVKANMKDKEKKKAFDNGLLELQANMDIVVSGIKEKQDVNGEKNGWSSTSYETMDHWIKKNQIESINLEKEEAKRVILDQTVKQCSTETFKKLEKIMG